MSLTVDDVRKQVQRTRASMRADIRQLLANYLSSEGCTCCQGSDHDKHLAALAKYLNVPKYDDGSGYDFQRYKPK